MPAVTVIPTIGVPTKDRLSSMSGCHALHEYAVTKAFQGEEEMGYVITDALKEIALSLHARRKGFTLDEMAYVLRFRG
jgi:hypothetical protein